MGAVLHDRTRGQDGIANMPDPADGTRRAAAAVHDAGIELVGALMGEHRPDAGVEQRALLKQPYRFRNGVQSATAVGQDRLAAAGDSVKRPAVVAFFFSAHRLTRQCAGATVECYHCFAHCNGYPVDT